jgi:intein/homing endonuclease
MTKQKGPTEAELFEMLMEGYRRSPHAYAQQVLGVNWWKRQVQISLAILKHKKVFVQASHAVGKCIPLSEAILTSSGRRRTGQSILYGTGPKGLKLITNVNGIQSEVDAIYEPNGIRPIWLIETKSGRRIRRTGNHPLFAASRSAGSGKPTHITKAGWRDISDIRPGDVVAVPSVISGIKHQNKMNEIELKLLAYLIGDGGYTASQVTFTQQDNEQLREFRILADNIGCQMVATGNYGYRIVAKDATKYKKGNNPVINLLRKHNLFGKHSRDKRIPNAIFNLSLGQLSIFLSRLYSTDGWAHTASGRAEIGFCSVSHEMCLDIQELLLRYGINASVSRRSDVNASVVNVLSCHDVAKFIGQIGIFGKEQATEKALLFAKDQKERVANGRNQFRWKTQDCPPNCHWDIVTECRLDGEEETVAICVPGHHTFFTTFFEHNSFLAAGLVNWMFDCFSPSVCLTTAPNAQQVRDVLWKEIRSQRGDRNGNSFLLPKEPRMERAPNHYAHGLTARDGNAFQGRHEEHIGIVFDEATGIAGDFYDGAEGMMTNANENAWFLAICNPTDVTSRAYQEVLSGSWYVMDIRAIDHPNIEAALRGEPVPYPNAVGVSYIDNMVRKYCEEIDPADRRSADILWALPNREGIRELDRSKWQCYRPGPMMESRVLGRWPTNSTSAIWSDAMWNASERRPDSGYLPFPDGDFMHKPVQIGCDVSWSGADYTSIVARRGGAALYWETHNGWKPIQIANGLKRVAKEMCDQHAKHFRHLPNYVGEDPRRVLMLVDHDATGNAVIEHMSGWNIMSQSGAGTPLEPEEYPNRRSEIWFSVADMADREQLDFSRLPEEARQKLRGQAMAPQWAVDGKGRRVVEEKRLTRKRIKRSPDDMDALNLAYAQPSAVIMRMPVRVTAGGKIASIGAGPVHNAPRLSPEILGKSPLTGGKNEQFTGDYAEAAAKKVLKKKAEFEFGLKNNDKPRRRLM